MYVLFSYLATISINAITYLLTYLFRSVNADVAKMFTWEKFSDKYPRKSKKSRRGQGDLLRRHDVTGRRMTSSQRPAPMTI